LLNQRLSLLIFQSVVCEEHGLFEKLNRPVGVGLIAELEEEEGEEKGGIRG
jgi:hypothetical protein